MCPGFALPLPSQGERRVLSKHLLSSSWFLIFSPSHLLQTSPGRRKGYEELLGCQEQDTNFCSPGWPRWLCRACLFLQFWCLSLTDFPFHCATEQALPTRATGLAREWVSGGREASACSPRDSRSFAQRLHKGSFRLQEHKPTPAGLGTQHLIWSRPACSVD